MEIFIMPHTLPPLPYETRALEPHISAKTLEIHHGKHHQAYVTNMNNLLKDHPDAALSLEEVIIKSHTDKNIALFNNAAQVWNHTFYWNSMKPQGGGKPTGTLLARIEQDFGSFEDFALAFKNIGLTQFGSGWAWLVLRDGKLELMKTGNAELPMTSGARALLTCDVWEHAYYLDYQNRRPDYLSVFLEHLVNWDFVEKNLGE